MKKEKEVEIKKKQKKGGGAAENEAAVDLTILREGSGEIHDNT